jgi:hypothetical protein
MAKMVNLTNLLPADIVFELPVGEQHPETAGVDEPW